MKKCILQKLITVGICAVIVLGLVQLAKADSTALPPYDGFDLETGIIEHDSSMLVLVAGDIENIKRILEMDMEGIPLDFSPSIDLHFELELTEENSIITVLKPAKNTKVALMENASFLDTSYSSAQELQFVDAEDFDEEVDHRDVVVVITGDGTYYKLGEIFYTHEFVVSVQYQELLSSGLPTPVPPEPSTVPEPSTFLLFGIGFLSIIGIFRKKRKLFFSSFTQFLVLGFLIGLLIGFSPLWGYAIEVGEIAAEDQCPVDIPEPQSCISEYIGESIVFSRQGAFYSESEGYQFISELVGPPIAYVKEGFPSHFGETIYYQDFETGVVLTPCGPESPGCVIFQDYYETWKELGFSPENQLGAPINNRYPDDYESSYGTIGQMQEFEEGVIVYHDGTAMFEGEEPAEDPIGEPSEEPEKSAYAIYDKIYEKWGSEDTWGADTYEKSPLGFPISSEEDTQPSGVSGKVGRKNKFEGGHIYLYDSRDGEIAFEVHGLINQVHVENDGVSGIMGFPITDEKQSNLGFSVQLFEGGYITSYNGDDYFAVEYAHDARVLNHLQVTFNTFPSDLVNQNPMTIMANTINWQPNFHAGFTIKNVGPATIIIEALGLGIYLDDGGEPDFALQDKSLYTEMVSLDERWHDKIVILQPYSSHNFALSDGLLRDGGDFWVIAKAEIRGVWYRLDWKNLKVTCAPEEENTIGLNLSFSPTVLQTLNVGTAAINAVAFAAIGGAVGGGWGGAGGFVVGVLVNMLSFDPDITIETEHFKEIRRFNPDCNCEEVYISGVGKGELFDHTIGIPFNIPFVSDNIIQCQLKYKGWYEYDLSDTSNDCIEKACGDATLKLDITGKFVNNLQVVGTKVTVDTEPRNGAGEICYYPGVTDHDPNAQVNDSSPSYLPGNFTVLTEKACISAKTKTEFTVFWVWSPVEFTVDIPETCLPGLIFKLGHYHD